MEDKDTALKKIAKGVGIVAIGMILSKILGYIYRFIIARVGVEQYGLFSIAFAVFSLLVTISLLGMGDGVIRFVSFYKGKHDERRIKGIISSSLKISTIMGIFFGIMLFILSDWIAVNFFHNTELSILLKIFAFVIPLDVLRNIFFNSAKAFQKVEYEVYAKSITENVAKVGLSLIAIYLGFGIIGVTIAYLLSVLASFSLSFYFLEKKIFPILKTKVVSITSDKKLLVYSLPLLFTGFIYLIIQWTDTLMLGYMKTSTEVGIYNVALPIAALLHFFPFAIRTLFFPILSEIHAQHKKSIFKSIYRSVVKWNIIVNSFLFIILIVFSTQIIRILFGESYIRDNMLFLGYTFPLSSLVLIILVFGMIPGDFLVPSKDVLLVLKKTKLIFFNTIIGSGLNIVLNYLLIPVYGLVGAAIATAFAHFVIVILVGTEAYFISKVNPFKAACFKVLSLATLMLISMLILKLYLIKSVPFLILIGIVSFLTYFVLLFITKSFDNEDVIILNYIIRKLGLKN